MKKFFGIFAGVLLACLPAAAQTQQTMQPIRINCGGVNYTDSNGQIWQADNGYNTGTGSVNAAVTTGTSDPVLYYQSNRFNQFAAPLAYSFAVPAGSYRVNLLFAENSPAQQAVGARVFNVKLNGSLVLNHFDIFAAMGANAAVVESFNTTVSGGTLAIEFDKRVQNPKINAIEILPVVDAPLLTMKFVYPDGTAATGTLHYAISTSLLTLGGSVALVNGQATCAQP